MVSGSSSTPPPPPQCDAISTLEKEHDYKDEHLDFIQSHVRRFCLQCILQPWLRSAAWHQCALNKVIANDPCTLGFSGAFHRCC